MRMKILPSERRFSEKLACPNGHPLAVDDLEPRSFSFNSPYGACPECAGLGIKKEVDPDLVVPDPDMTLAEGAIAPWSMGQNADYFVRLMAGLGDALGFDVDTPWKKLPAAAKKAILDGSSEQVHVRYKNRYGRTRSYYAEFEGVLAFLQRRMEQTESEWAKERYEGFMRDIPCPVCEGTRLKPEILSVTLTAGEHGTKSIAEVCDLSIADCAQFLGALTSGTVSRPSRVRYSRRSNSGWDSCWTSACSTCRCRARQAHCPAVRRSVFGWRLRSVRVWSASSMFSMNPRSDCISGTIVASSKPSPG